MILFPAIDLKDGAVVRLLRGELGRATIYNADPVAQAADFAATGFSWLHIVDLDGAVEGRSVNGEAVARILAETTLKVQLGGGIRTLAAIEGWLARGVTRVVLGTVAVKEPQLVRDAARLFPGRVAVSIDARAGLVAVEGWTKTSELRALDLALRMEDAGVAAIVYTDIDRDGALGGVNLDATVDLAFALQVPVIASGGVASLDDLVALKREEAAGIEGVICGRALYDGRIDPKAALQVLG